MTAPIDRLMRRVVLTPGPLSTECWVPTFRPTTRGYIKLGLPDGTEVLAHRFSYEHHVGPVPDGFQVDHLCFVRACVNPTHLEAVTPRENWLRSSHPSAVAYLTDTCKRGHSLKDAPDYGKGRKCRQCGAMHAAEYRAAI